MNRQKQISIALIGISILAIITGLWGFLIETSATFALISAVLLLVAAQILLLFMFFDRKMPQQPAAASQQLQLAKAVTKIHKRLGRIEGRLGKLSEQAALASPPLEPRREPQLEATGQPGAPIVHDHQVSHDRKEHDQHSQQNTQDQSFAAGQRAGDDGPPPQARANPAEAEPTHLPAYLDDTRLSLYLEPVIDISKLSTAFYRAELAFQSEMGARIRMADAMSQIEKDGNACAVDMKLFTSLGPVINRLAARGSVLGVICPISRHAFADEKFLAELTTYLQLYPNLARVVIIEIAQSDLAGLSEDGMAGLAFLAQAGAMFSLGGAGLESPDLASLASLGFAYLDLDYAENIRRYGWPAFATDAMADNLRKTANEYGIGIIGSGLMRKSQYDALNNFIQFGRGAAFSPPRLVRADFSEQPAEQTGEKAA